MVITPEQRSTLEELIALTARSRALGHEHDNPTEAGRLKELVTEHQALSARKAEAAEAVEHLREQVGERSEAIERLRAQIVKKTAELNDGTGLTSKDLVNLQNEIAGHEDSVSEREEAELLAMEELESAEAVLSKVESSLSDVTAEGKSVQTSIKERKAQ